MEKKKEEMLDEMIRFWGFEHPYTISIATMIETNVSIKTIEQTVKGLIKMNSL